MAGFCSDTQSQNNKNQWVDPLGPSSLNAKGQAVYTPTGAPQIRSQLFDYLKQYQPQMNQAGQDYATGLKTAAGDSGWAQAADLAKRTMSGQYLNGSPQLDAAMDANRRAHMAAAADSSARIKSQFNQNGMGFSTGYQQADQGAQTNAAADAANTNAQVYLQNYMGERANQNNAVNNLATATSTPLNYLSGVSGAYTQPLDQAGNLLSALSSGGQVSTTGSSGTYNPSAGSDILNGIGAANSVYSTVMGSF